MFFFFPFFFLLDTINLMLKQKRHHILKEKKNANLVSIISLICNKFHMVLKSSESFRVEPDASWVST
jgi:hypothetical protein